MWRLRVGDWRVLFTADHARASSTFLPFGRADGQRPRAGACFVA